ncbi:pitrilysin family protein [Ferruginibacter sp.]|uniref:M16 family metallopeptidase n=1 Tax=Ferruginibacter sp. TaxID=1940288 RepID=UPI0019C571C9|nr:pitrilysin family protein [Ferruginibacter sp.]MBC7625724.1 insulinase family protein [Ferruginibacter sp.]
MKKVIIVALSIVLLQHGFAQIKVDRSKKPAAGPAPAISIKDPVIFTLPNGMTVLVVENHKFPKVSASLNIDAGPILEGKRTGLVNLMGQMLGEGTTNMPKDKFDEAVDIIGAEVSLYASGGSASALTRYFEKAFNLMADGLKNPAFPQASFDKLKSLTITGLKSNEKSAPAIAARVNAALSYGKQTAMGEFTTEETVKGLILKDVKDAYKNYITPSRSYLTFVGDITPAAAKELTTKAFGRWSGKKLSLPVIPLVKNPAKTEIDFVDVPTAVQGELNVGNLVSNPMNNKDYHALLVANQILGGGAESKLFMNLREKHGFTYGSYSRIGSGRFQSLFTASAAVRSDKVDSATAEIFSEILNMRDGKITQEELDIAKAKYNGSFALGMEDPSRTATYASNILINNLPKDFYKTFLQKINSVSLNDLKRVSGIYFNENHSRIVIAGNGSVILPKLMRLGYPVKKFDRYANPVIDKAADVKGIETAKNTNSISASEIIETYLKAIGGKDEVKKVTSMSSVIGLDMMGRSFEGVEKKMNPGMQMLELKMGTMTVMKMVFNGTSGFQQQGPQKKDLSEKEIKEAQDDKGVIPQLYYITDGAYKTDYLGTGKVDDEDTYRLKVVMPSGRTSIQEYSVKTGLLLKEETTSIQEGADIPMTIEYKNYKKTGALLLPTEITRNAGGQEIPFKYKEIKLNEGVTDADFK